MEKDTQRWAGFIKKDRVGKGKDRYRKDKVGEKIWRKTHRGGQDS